MKSAVHMDAHTVTDIEFQAASIDIWDAKYRLTAKDGNKIDDSIDATYKRVALALAGVEVESKREQFYKDFLWALRSGAIPAGRIISNAGAREHKPATSTINCTVSGTVGDSMDNILNKVHEAGLTLKAGCGIGYEFSTLRPKGAYVTGAGAYTSGPLSFMDIYDKMCFTVSSAGGRRGAQMGTFDVGHPDIMEFIRAKREDGRLRQFNLSLLVTDEFMQAVINEDDWSLAFPATQKEVDEEELDINDSSQFVWREWPEAGNYVTDSKGLVACKIYKVLPARRVWDLIMASTYDFAEPGFVLIDKVNEMNNNWFDENIRATNPCGEQPLPPYGSCLLGSVNLTRFVVDPFTAEARFDWEGSARSSRHSHECSTMLWKSMACRCHSSATKFRESAATAWVSWVSGRRPRCCACAMAMRSRSSLPKRWRGSWRWLAGKKRWNWRARKGPAPIMNEQFEVTEAMLRKRPEMMADGYQVGDKVRRTYFACALQPLYAENCRRGTRHLSMQLAETGARFTHHSSIAPTGTISLSLANNASNGIEPSFAHHYFRNVIRQGKKTKEKVDVFSFELLAYRELVDQGSDAGTAQTTSRRGNNLPDYFITAEDVSPKAHVDIQAAAQKWIDSSISKTANVPTDFPYEDFKDVYLYAYRAGSQGMYDVPI